MKLYPLWLNAAFEKKGGIKKDFWYDYMPVEKLAYEKILSDKKNKLTGTVTELAKEFNMNPLYFCGLIDGMNESLVAQIDMKELTEDAPIEIEIDFAQLYKKMVDYKAEHLYTLQEWNNIFDEEKRKELYREQKESRTIRSDDKIGRNDLCPCGSGRKYKKCCGA